MKHLTDRQITRATLSARQNMRHADTMMSCLPEELGATVAEDFCDNTIEFLIQALEVARKIKIQLRLRAQIGGKNRPDLKPLLLNRVPWAAKGARP